MNFFERPEKIDPAIPLDAEEYFSALGPVVWPNPPVHIVDAMNELVEQKLIVATRTEYKDGNTWKRVQSHLDLDSGVSYRLSIFARNRERYLTFTDVRVRTYLVASNLIKLYDEQFANELHQIDVLRHPGSLSYNQTTDPCHVYFKLTGVQDDSGEYPVLFRFDKSASFIPYGKGSSTYSWQI